MLRKSREAAGRAEVSEEVVTRLFYGLLGKNPEQRQDERDECRCCRPQQQHGVGTKGEPISGTKCGIRSRTKQLGAQQPNEPRHNSTQGSAEESKRQSAAHAGTL